MNRTAWIFLAAIVVLGIIGVYVYDREQAPVPSPSGLANPASVNCVNQGGTLEVSQDASGGAVGYCHLKDGRVCEEWAFFRDGSCSATTTPASSSAQ